MQKIFKFEELHLAAQALKRGEVIAIPTETVYGLAADITQSQAVEQIFKLKGRPTSHPLIIHIANPQDLALYTKDIPGYVDHLIQAFWPGPLTLILKKTDAVSEAVTGGQATVAVRMPSHPIAKALIEQVGHPLAAPSANRFGKVSPTHYQHVLSEFDGTVSVIDGGACQVGIESTILDVTNHNQCTILRPGMIEAIRIAALLGSTIPVLQHQKSNVSDIRASGMLKYHYAPTKPAFIVQDLSELQQRKIDYPDGIVLLSHSQRLDGIAAIDLKLPADAEGYARTFYDQLRSADASSHCAIAIEAPPQGLGWAGIWDRILKATAK